MSELVAKIEALLFLSPDPVGAVELAEACESDERSLADALNQLRTRCEQQSSGLALREIGGGFLLASKPISDDAAKRLFSKPRTPPLSQAQAETLAIVVYLQPVSRPEIARIRGVSADSATNTLIERGLIEESGRSQFGASLYRTSELFLKLFGLNGLANLPDISQFDPTTEDERELRDKLLRAGEQRAGG